MRIRILIAFFVAAGFMAFSQDINDTKNPVVATVGGEAIRLSELRDAYLTGAYSDKQEVSGKELADFLQSYILFRLNAEEGRVQRLDTLPRFKRDYSAFRLQMAPSFLRDSVRRDTSLQLAVYDRMQTDLEINHLLLPFGKKVVFPADTLLIYNKAADRRRQLQKSGFTGEGFSDYTKRDTLSSVAEHNGYAGWIMPFMLPEQVESAAYSMKTGEISQPIRSSLGYHIIQVIDKRPAKGIYTLERVLLPFPFHIATKQQKDSMVLTVARLADIIGKDKDAFAELCADYARSVNSSNGCLLGSVMVNSKYPPVFLSEVYKQLAAGGDISKPIATAEGYSIVRLVAKPGVPDYSRMRDYIMNEIRRSDKIEKNLSNGLALVSAQYNIEVDDEAYAKIRNIANSLSPRDTLFAGQIGNRSDVLFSIRGAYRVTVGNFADYLAYKAYEANKKGLVTVREIVPNNFSLASDDLRSLFDTFLFDNLNRYVDFSLESRVPAFKEIMDKYASDLLVFEVLDKNIWQKAKTDDKGLAGYFGKNKKKYKWENPRYKGLILHCKTQESADATKAAIGKRYQKDDVIKRLRETVNKDSITVRVEPGVWEKGTNPVIDRIIYGVEQIDLSKDAPYAVVVGREEKSPQEYTDVRPEVERDYEEQLMEEWKKHLFDKYDVRMSNPALSARAGSLSDKE